jgi:hypothetical protein
MQGDINVGKNVDKSVIVDGNNNVINYYAGGESALQPFNLLTFNLKPIDS